MKFSQDEIKELRNDQNYEYIRDNTGRYNKLFRITVILTTLVAVAPLITMAIVNIYQYQKAFKADIIYPLKNQTTNIRNTLESFIEERYSVLKFITKEQSFNDLADLNNLSKILRHLKESYDGFIDLGIVNSKGFQISYVGPYNLQGKNYNEQSWFNEAVIKGDYISDVFMGYRGLPHFTIAIIKELNDNDFYVLRATINSDKLYSIIMSQKLLPSNDVFLINNKGILQTSSKYNGNILNKWFLSIPPYSSEPEIIDKTGEDRNTSYNKSLFNNTNYFLAYSYIKNTPFILIETTQSESVMGNWQSTRNNILIFLCLSIVIIVIVIFWGSYRMIKYIKAYDYKMIKFLRNVSYTNKLAAIGRLAAGVSHEINNPLSIINENAGVIKDIIAFTEDFPAKEKIDSHTNSIINSVDRCSRITHRLLGFAKRMDVHIDSINIKDLISEVISFVYRELQNRNISIDINSNSDTLIIQSDKGQLQQVFLNIINNAIDAVKNGGNINIDLTREDRKSNINHEMIKILVKDNGIGISQDDIEKIFDPFYSSKSDQGTGLGLFITYGIIQKLGGSIEVKSEFGHGTTFMITLPTTYQISGE